MFLNKLKPCYRLFTLTCTCTNQVRPRRFDNFVRSLHVSSYAMAQRSITSFFKITPPSKKASLDTEVNEDKIEKKPSKRSRLESSESENEVQEKVESPVSSTEKKKKPKRQRIDSSESESDVKESPQKTIKLEKVSPKTYQSPKSKKANSIEKKVNKTEKKVTNVDKKSPKVKKEVVSPKTKSRSPSPVKVESKDKKENVKPENDGKVKNGKVESGKSDKTENGIVPEKEYDPSKSKYHPIDDACWKAGQPVPYLALARTLHCIEQTSARLKIIDILANYLRSVIALTPEDLLPSIYLCLNQLAPAYCGLELGIAETYLMKAVGACTGRTVSQIRGACSNGRSLAEVATSHNNSQRTLMPHPHLKLRGVYATLKEIANMTGHASVNKKISKIQSLYVACRDCEATFLIRSLEGKLRIGLAEQSVLSALGLAVTLTPPPLGGEVILDASKGMTAEAFKSIVDANTLTIKCTYCSCPSYERVLSCLLEHGVQGLPSRCPLTPGLPTKPMLAHPAKGVHEVFNRFEGCEFTCEWKYDGERAQIHVPAVERGEGGAGAEPDYAHAAVFSRNQENNTTKYPDVVRRLPSLLKPTVTSCILDCEAVAFDTVNKQILPFQILSTRKRKDAVEEDIKVAVCVYVFDLLLLNGRSLVNEELKVRRELLREHFNQVPGEWQFATSEDCSSMEEVQQFLEAAVKNSCEGLMVKTLVGEHARYDIARRSRNWLKLKKDYLEGVGDSVDVVIIGAYRGRGRRAHTYGGFLCAARDEQTDNYQSLCRLGTGFTDDDLQRFTDKLKEYVIDAPRNYYNFDKSHTPDVWVSPVCVWEVKCADLCLSPAHRAAIGLLQPDKGISLRFPRFIRERDDKTPEQATTSQQIVEMYLAQDQVKNQTVKQEHNIDDFY